MTPRQYDLLLTRSQKFAVGFPPVMLAVLLPACLLVFGSGHFAELPGDRQSAFFPLALIALFVVLAVFYVWNILSLPHRISVTDEKQLVFKSVIASRTVRVSELVSIEPHSLSIQAGLSGYLLRHRNGHIRFPGQFTGLYVLLSELKQTNPTLDIRGC